MSQQPVRILLVVALGLGMSSMASASTYRYLKATPTLKVTNSPVVSQPTPPIVVLTPAMGELVAQTSTDFGELFIGRSAVRAFTFHNSGQQPATGVFASVTGPGLVTDNGCGSQSSPVTVAGGADCTITVTFAPSVMGTLQGALSVTSSADNSPATSAELTGSVVAPYAVLLDLTGEGPAVTDSSGAGLVVKNGVGITNSTVKSGNGALSFNARGTNGFIQTAVSPNYSLTTADLTMEAWIRPNTWDPNAILSNYPTGAWGSGAWALTFNHGAAPGRLSFFINAVGGSPMLASTSTPALNTWTHVAVTRAGSTWRMFVNGKLEATNTYSGSIDGAAGPRTIGVGLIENGGWSWGFTGQMDNVRVTTGRARYTSNFTPAY